jgi:hypothetical protein
MHPLNPTKRDLNIERNIAPARAIRLNNQPIVERMTRISPTNYRTFKNSSVPKLSIFVLKNRGVAPSQKSQSNEPPNATSRRTLAV